MRMKAVLSFVLFFLFSMGGGCAKYKPLHVDVRPVDRYENRIEYNGLSIAVDPFDTPEKAESAFYMDITQKNYKPLHIIIHSRSSDNFLIQRQSVYLSSLSEADLYPVESSYVYSKFEYSPMLRAILLGGIFSFWKADDANEKMKADWYSKQLPSEVTLRKGRRLSGFAFFETANRLQGKTVNIPVINLSNNSKEEILRIEIK